MYRYVCEKCGNEEVHLHGLSETPSLSCGNCGGKMSKTIGKVGIVFKGSGFYITDSKNPTKAESKTE